MQHYKAPDNSLHVIDPEFVYLLPVGCVPISDAEADELRPKPSNSEVIASIVAEIRKVREGILNRLAGIALAAQLEGDTATAEAYLVVRAGLLDITKNLPSDPADLQQDVQMRYAALVAQCTPQMVGAFAQLDA